VNFYKELIQDFLKVEAPATVATPATVAAKTPENTPTVATVATVARGGTSKSDKPETPTVATVATVASPLSFFPAPALPNVRDLHLVKTLLKHGLQVGEANALAAKLEQRKAEMDDRKICLECRYLIGGRMCTNALRAGLSVSHAKTAVALGQNIQLQRCPGFGSTMH
jgi:hypothetical protein